MKSSKNYSLIEEMAAKLGRYSKAEFAYSIYVSVVHLLKHTYLQQTGLLGSIRNRHQRDANYFKVWIPVISLYIKQEPQSKAWCRRCTTKDFFLLL